MRRTLDLVKWSVLALLIITVLLLNACLLVHYRRHNTVSRTSLHDPRPSTPAPTPRPTNHRIPRIVHLMWSERLVPTEQLQYVSKWVQHNPDWSIWFWTDPDFDRLLTSHYPHLKQDYRGLNQHDKIVSRRYFIIHRFGGVWADLDIEPLKPLEPLLKDQTCLLSQEPLVNAKLGWRIDMMIGAAIFACRPEHPYFELVLNLLLVNGKDPHTLAASGSVMLSRVYFRYKELTKEMNHPHGAISVAEPEVFMPLLGESYLKSLQTDCSKLDGLTEVRQPFCDKYKPLGYKNAPIPDTSYTVHHFYRNWAKGLKIDKSTTNKRDIFEIVSVKKPKL